MVGPDSATCAMLAATLAPLATAGDQRSAELSAAVAVVAAIACFIVRFMRLGFIADFLSEPILTGFLNASGRDHNSRTVDLPIRRAASVL